MRIIQLDTMKRMKRHFSRFYMTYDQTRILSEFTNEVAMNLKEDNDCVELIDKLNLLRKDYEKWICLKIETNLKIERYYFSF